MTEILLPCRKCGGEAVIIENEISDKRFSGKVWVVTVFCKSCHAYAEQRAWVKELDLSRNTDAVKRITRERAIEIWNRKEAWEGETKDE